jgi:hypothetical protein
MTTLEQDVQLVLLLLVDKNVSTGHCEHALGDCLKYPAAQTSQKDAAAVDVFNVVSHGLQTDWLKSVHPAFAEANPQGTQFVKFIL